MPALTSPITGNGTTVSGLGQTTLVKKISGLQDTLGGFEVSALATTGYKELKKQDLAENPKVTVEVYHLGTAMTLGATGTFTITWPSAGSVAGTGWVSSIKYPDAANGEAMMMSYEVTYDGATGPAYTPA
jgi:hypothetical protein